MSGGLLALGDSTTRRAQQQQEQQAAAVLPLPPPPCCWRHHPTPARHEPLPLLSSGPAPPCPAALNREQKALLDFLVLARSERFAGFGSSTFSFYLREYRALQVGEGRRLLCPPSPSARLWSAVC